MVEPVPVEVIPVELWPEGLIEPEGMAEVLPPAEGEVIDPLEEEPAPVEPGVELAPEPMVWA